jgi:hypothetical protein
MALYGIRITKITAKCEEFYDRWDGWMCESDDQFNVWDYYATYYGCYDMEEQYKPDIDNYSIRTRCECSDKSFYGAVKKQYNKQRKKIGNEDWPEEPNFNKSTLLTGLRMHYGNPDCTLSITTVYGRW